MTQLRNPSSVVLKEIRSSLSTELKKQNFKEIDANSLIAGRDFFDKIWKQILGVPLGIAIFN